ncbi:hypothetical protein PHYC_01049 [Phycisphaerales bacterium]|nr:hypothetical protein PHYC_01049 [Phycisphaerales bacterium]
MNYYEIWVNLKDSRKDLEFCQAVNAYMRHLQKQGRLESWRITRRKFGFGPDGLGEFHISLAFKDLTQMDTAFGEVATRTGAVEQLHNPVYSMVTDFKSALYRDFPDPERSSRP